MYCSPSVTASLFGVGLGAGLVAAFGFAGGAGAAAAGSGASAGLSVAGGGGVESGAVVAGGAVTVFESGGVALPALFAAVDDVVGDEGAGCAGAAACEAAAVVFSGAGLGGGFDGAAAAGDGAGAGDVAVLLGFAGLSSIEVSPEPEGAGVEDCELIAPDFKNGRPVLRKRKYPSPPIRATATIPKSSSPLCDFGSSSSSRR